MKKTLMILLLATSNYAFAQQVLVGTYNAGGSEGTGGIYIVETDGSSYQAIAPVPLRSAGVDPSPGLIQHSNGRVFGINTGQGDMSGGVLYEWDVATSSQINPVSFTSYSSVPDAPIELPDGKLLGISSTQGSSFGGYMFTYDIDTRQLKVIFEFDQSSTGATPVKTPRLASNGLLYGTTSGGGSDGFGTIYQYDYVNDVFTVLHHIGSGSSADSFGGASPIEAADGLLYGVLQTGVIYAIDVANSGLYSEKHTMSVNEGSGVLANLTEASNGLLYGTSVSGGANGRGTIFTWNTQTNTFTKIFDNTTNIGQSFFDFTEGANQKLYNVSNSSDTFHEVDPTTNQVSQLFDFDGVDAEVRNPSGKLVELTPGFFLGTGQRNNGGVYSLDINTSTYNTLLQFGEDIVGTAPFRGVLNGNDGWLYGVTSQNGAALYRAKLETKVYELLHEFGSDEPTGSLILASNGLIYGTTKTGGTSSDGTIFSYDPVNTVFAELHEFSGTDGTQPTPLTLGSNNKLYGVTQGGGTSGVDGGVMYEFDISTNTFTKLAEFDAGVNAIEKPGPEGLVMGPNGNFLYGTTSLLNAIFRFDISTNNISALVSFSSLGNSVVSKLAVDASNNKLYGVASRGGVSNQGTLFEYSLSTFQLSSLHTFSFGGNNASARPEGNMKLINDKLIGSFRSPSGGIFTYDLTTNQFSVSHVANEFTGQGFTGGFAEYCLSPLFETEQLTYMVCAGETLTLDVLTGNTETGQWSGTDGNPIPGETFAQLVLSDISSADQGDYTFEMVNSCGINTVTFTVNVTEIESTFSTTNATCNGASDGSIVFQAASGGVAPYSYSIDNGTTSQSELSFENISLGTYETLVTDANGCSLRQMVVVNEPDPIESSIVVSNATCNAENDGTITFESARGGTGPFTYSIDNGTTSQSQLLFENLSAGTYETLVTDANGCELRQTITVDQPDLIESNITISNVTCNGENDGTITFESARGGTEPFTYSIDNGSTSQSELLFENLSAGTYETLITDANGCTLNQSITLTAPDQMILTTQINEANKSVIVTVSGGVSPYEYSLDKANFQSSNVFENLDGGSYEITVRDGNGCLATTETVDIVLGTRAIGVKIYPNPAVHELMVEGVEFDQGYLFNLQGKEVSRFDSARTLVDDLKAGLYILKLYQNENLIHTEKIKIN